MHPPPVGLEARGAWIVEAAAVDRAPEIRVELEVGHAPPLAHGAEDLLEMCLRARMRAVHRVPGPAAPAAEGHAVRAQGSAVRVLHEPVRVVPEVPGAG